MKNNVTFLSNWRARIFPAHEPAVTDVPASSPEESPLIKARDWNGRVREQAMHDLASLEARAALPALIIRLNDWVPQVRHAARAVFRSFMTQSNARAFVDCLPLIAHLGFQQRDDHAALITEIHAYLMDQENAHHLIQGMSAENPRVARLASRLCLEHALLPEHDLVERCLTSADMLTRMSVIPLLSRGDVANHLPLLTLALHNSSMPLRRAAFVIYCKELPEASTDIARAMLFDRSIALRELVLNVLLKRKIDVPALLLPILDQTDAGPRQLRYAIWNLTQLGQHQIVPRLKELRQHAQVPVRMAAVLALAELEKANADDYLMEGLRDSSPVVTKSCTRQLIKNQTAMRLDDLLDLLKLPAAHQHEAALLLLPLAGKWHWLTFLLEAMRKYPQFMNSVTTGHALRQWNDAFNRSNARITTHQTQRIRRALEQCNHLLSTGQRELLEFSLPSMR